jgi:hypothetical protein
VLTGTNGADALPQAVATDSDTSGSTSVLTLGSAWANDDSRGLSFFYGNSGTSGVTWTATETGFTTLGSLVSGASDNAGNWGSFHGRNSASVELGASSSISDIRVALGFEVAGADDEAATAVTFAYPRVRQTGLNGRLN